MTLPAKYLSLIVLALAAAWWWWPREKLPSESESVPPQAKVTGPQSTPESLAEVLSVPAGRAPEPDPPTESSPAERQLVLDAIDNLEFAFRDFAAALGGNPVGNNAEITAALLGDNLRQVKIPLPAGSTMNALGELCDPWGTPWFFHQISGSKMEIRSAGPDRVLYSEDDVVR
jgi:hypothetical protein